MRKPALPTEFAISAGIFHDATILPSSEEEQTRRRLSRADIRSGSWCGGDEGERGGERTCEEAETERSEVHPPDWLDKDNNRQS